MTQGSVTATIDAPPQAVWPWIAQLGRHAQWSPRAYEVQLVSGEAGAVGSRYTSEGWIPGDGHHRNEVEIIEVVPDVRLRLRAEDPQGAFDNTFELRPVDGGTEVRFTLVFPKMSGISALMVPVLFPLVGMADLRKRMALLKQRVESG